IRGKPPLQVRLPVLVHRQPPSKLAPHESCISRQGNPKNHTSAKVVLALWSLDAALENAKRGIRVNLVYPGRTDSPLINNFIRDDGPMARARQEAGAFERISSVIGRIAHAREVAWPVVFLASDAASYITGARLPVEGGFLKAVELGRL
ncbi:SDR family oxidoreductase, partial [Sphingosinicella sp.]|uniref:SDR family oxidoreductase n=1 Tax=Sphingosinicella sp. TaxID=1917971 RepID=UPI00262C7A63